MSENNTEVVSQLRSIKRWVAVGAVGFFLIGVGATVFSISMMQMTSIFDEDYFEEDCEDDLIEFSWDSASDLFDQNKSDELMSLIEQRLSTHPNDATAHWYKAKLFTLNKQWDLAIKSIEKTELYSPSWKQDYTVPLRESIERLRE